MSAVIRYLKHLPKSHPTRKDSDGKPAGTIVDYNLTLILVPVVVIGSAIGAIINKITPEPIQVGIFLLILLIVFCTTIPRLYRICVAE